MRDGMLKCQINQIAALFKVSILKATHSEAVCSAAGVHTGSAAVEAEAAGIGTTNRTAPIVAAGENIPERTIDAAAVARHRQFKRGGKSPHRCIYTPT